MPKSKDKTKGATKRQKSPGNSAETTDENERKPAAKKKKIQKRTNSIEGIEMSKQLKQQLKRPRTIRNTNSKRNCEPRLCGNGKPMPSLAELERMYEDSDGDDEPLNIKPPTSPSRCVTPETKPDTTLKITEETLASPTTLKKIASRVIDMLSNVTVIPEEDGPPPPVIPPKKPNKSGIPYIVGCTERKQVPFAPKNSFCKGSPTYGVDPNDANDSDLDCGENIGPHYANISKSIFNAQSEEIAERLKELERLESLGLKMEPTAVRAASATAERSQPPERNGSPDSNRTVPYEFPDSPRSQPRSFSPLPSTSKDNETISKNDKLFNESLKCESVNSQKCGSVNSQKCESLNSHSTKDDVEIIEVPCETIVIDDALPDKPKQANTEPMDVDLDLDDDCCVIVESESTAKPKRISNSPIEIKDEIYGSLDLTKCYDDSDVFEVIDVDDVISENNALLNKYKRESLLDSVILVEPNTISSRPTTSNPLYMSPTTPPQAHHTNSEVPTYTTLETVNRQNLPFQSPAANDMADTGHRNNISDIVTGFFSGTILEPINADQNREVQMSVNNTTTEIPSSTIQIGDNRTVPPRYLESGLNGVGRILSWLANIPCRGSPGQSRKESQRRGNSSVPENNQDVQSNIRSQVAAPNVTTHVQKNTAPLPTQPPTPSPVTKGLGDCPICMDSLANTAIASTLCGHIFCMNCIKISIRSNGKKCPTCRKTLKGVGYHQLFL